MAPALKGIGTTLRRIIGLAPNDIAEAETPTVDAELVQRVRACESVVEESGAILDEATRETGKREEALAAIVAAHDAAAKAFEADDSDANATALVAAREKVPRARALATKALDQQEQLSRSFDQAIKALDDARADVDRAAKLRACSTEVFHANAAPIAVKMIAALEEAMSCAHEIDRLRAESNTIAHEVGVEPLGAEHAILDALRLLADEGSTVVEDDWRALRNAMTPETVVDVDGYTSSEDNQRFAVYRKRSLAYGVAVQGLVGVLGTIRHRIAKSVEERAQTSTDLDLMFATRGVAGVEERNAAARHALEDDRKRIEEKARTARAERETRESREREERLQKGPGPDRSMY